MSWFVLIVSGLFEAVWAIALGASDGLRRRRPTLVFLVAMIVSMAGLAYAMIELPTGTAYAVWVGIGASLAAAWSMATRQEAATVLRIGLLLLLIGSVVGLRAVS